MTVRYMCASWYKKDQERVAREHWMPGGDSRLALGYGLFRTAVNWGLRSPNSDTNNAYNINTDGSVNNNNVNNPNFAARPALMEYRVQVANRESRGPSSKEAISCRPRARTRG